MPTIIKNFEWKQTSSHLIINVPIKVVQKSKLDLFFSQRYVKVSYEHYIFEVILLFSIDELNCKCIITSDYITLELKKNEEDHWESLEPMLSKQEKNALKKDLLEDSYKRIEKLSEETRIKKSELKRTAVRKQIETDTEIRKTIDLIKEEEKSIVLGDTDEWIKKIKKNSQQKHKHIKTNLKSVLTNNNATNIELEKNIDSIMLPRQQKTLEVEFTNREFPTPSRESKLDEEQEWLSNQAAARRSCGFISEDIRPEERSPQFLKAKGDEFLKNKNYLGAISAYSYGIKISPKFVDFYIYRSEAHFQLGKYEQTFKLKSLKNQNSHLLNSF